MYSLLESDVRGIRNAGEGRQLPKRWDLRKHSKDLRSWLCRNLCKKKCFQEVNFDLHFILTKGKWWHMAQFSRSVVSNPVIPWTAAHQASLSITNSQSLPKPISIESVMPSNYLILSPPSPPVSIFPSIRVFSNESVVRIRWPKNWSFSFSITPSSDSSGWISFRID